MGCSRAPRSCRLFACYPAYTSRQSLSNFICACRRPLAAVITASRADCAPIVARSAESPYARAVKRAFADALLAEIHRARVGRREVAQSGHVSRTYLQLLLAAERHAT